MSYDVEQIASDWITYTRYDADKAPEDIFARGWVLYDLVQDDPHAAWAAIKEVVARYTADELYSPTKTEAQRAVGNLAAGPLEDLLSDHFESFFAAAEAEAHADRKMAWTLGGVWQSGMSDEQWARLRRVADYSYWERPA